MKLVVPNEIRYGLVERYDTYTKKLGFMIYANKSNGTYGQQVSFDSWRDKKFEPKDISNEYQLGFVLNKGHLNKYHFGASAKFRVFHPEGFEFEISLENLSLLLDNSIINYGEIQVPCCIAWDGPNVYLLPKIDMKDKVEVEHFDVHQSKDKAEKRLEKINNSGKPLATRTLTSGKIVEDANGKRFVVVSHTKSNFHKDPLTGFRVMKENNDFVIVSSKKHSYSVGFNPEFEKMFYPLTDTSGIIEKKKENEFFKFVNENDLTSSEAKNLKKLQEKNVLQFNEKQEFVPLNQDGVDSFIDNIIEKYSDVKFSDYNNDGKVIILDQVVKMNDRLYHVILGQSYRFGYGVHMLEDELKHFYNKYREISNSRIHGAYARRENIIRIFFLPFTSEEDEYAGLSKTRSEGFVVPLEIMDATVIKEYHDLSKEHQKAIKTNLAKKLKPLEQREIDAQKRIYWSLVL